MKMNKWVWYGLVIVAVWLLLNSFLQQDFLKGILALGIAIILKKQYHNIPLPRAIKEHLVYIDYKKKTINHEKS